MPKNRLKQRLLKQRNMAEKETLTFKIGISGTYWNKRPAYSIAIDDVVIIPHKETLESDQIDFIQFQHTIDDDAEHSLKITLLNKDDSDTVESTDKTTIIKDMLLNVKSVEIDDIDLGQLIWTSSEFIAADPSRPTLNSCVNLGWNGSYILKFRSPFYLWLLENL